MFSEEAEHCTHHQLTWAAPLPTAACATHPADTHLEEVEQSWQWHKEQGEEIWKGKSEQTRTIHPSQKITRKSSFLKPWMWWRKLSSNLFLFGVFLDTPSSFLSLPHVQAMQCVAYTLSGQLCVSLHEAVNIKMVPSERTNPWKISVKVAKFKHPAQGGHKLLEREEKSSISPD